MKRTPPPSHLQNQQNDNKQFCYLWVPILKHEKDDELGLSFSSIAAKNNTMMVSNATACRHLLTPILEHETTQQRQAIALFVIVCWVHVPKHEEDEKLSSSSSFTLAKNNMTMTSNCTTCHRLWVHVPKDEEDEELRLLSSFTLVKKNIMMISNCTICCHLLVLVLDHEDNDKQRS